MIWGCVRAGRHSVHKLDIGYNKKCKHLFARNLWILVEKIELKKRRWKFNINIDK